ncbi:DUF6809 family protein [Paenibacillus thiaminolyticus]|uniref:DUF6809 family protein n=1 Tax=Paenibacillus thiaminolyticus TaxID=49283 RepID=UPI001162ED82|nr:DUF6809 family protein [Paenibacillus thiaminolyticus]NGP61486.1 hypothetical protein [Paenibacillus thiaminolyticus]
MKTILGELYHGNLCPEAQIVSNDLASRDTTQKITEEMKRWRERLPESEYDQLEDLMSLVAEMNAPDSFVYGFKLGAMMMIEVLGTGEK